MTGTMGIRGSKRRPRRAAVWAAGVVLLTGLLADAGEATIQRYEGAAHIGNVDRITVVYPTAEGEAGEVFRDSAELRASYLFERYGVIAEVAADTRVTVEQRNGHLLLLGWNNALLGTPEAPMPFQKDASGFTFAGARGLAQDDLLFMTTSPYNPSKYLSFWSRIHPEMDRYLSYPFVGSDWVIYRDHLHARQGMFAAGTSWPPKRDEHAEHETNFRTPPLGRHSKHYAMYYVGSVLDDDKADAVLEAREQALEQAAALLGVKIPEDLTIHLYVYLDGAHKQRETGVADPVHTLTHRSELYMPRALAQRSVPHEEIHLLAARVLGSCSLTAMYEGLAFATESRPDELAAFAGLMVEQDAVPDLATLFDDEKLRKLSAKGQGFPAAGLMIHWLRNVAGNEGLMKAYSLRRGNVMQGVARLTGTTPDTVGAAFADWVRALAADSEHELSYRKALREAHQRGKVGDFTGRAEALTRALEIKSDDPQVRYQLGLAYLEDGEYERARDVLQALIDQAAGLEGSYVVIFSHYQQGRAHQLAGRLNDARVAYRRVLDMPDQHGAHRLAQEALEAIGVADSKGD